VNGRRDVVFDARTAPSLYGAPLAPVAPELPYWVTVTSFKDGPTLPEGAVFSPITPGATAGTISFRLDGASYDPETKTCSAVSCHLKQATVQWGGTGLGTMSSCFGCHSSH
jgi:predicted CxxxxCH...CXXCH cytochrome family protein